MSDNDRNRDPMAPQPVRETERTTVVHTDGGRGGSGILIGVILLIAVLALLFFLFGGNLNDAADGDINVNVDAPELQVPEVDIEVPDVDLKVPDVDVDVDDAPANQS